MFMEGELGEVMVKVSPKICQNYFIMSSKGVPLLYVQIQKALYGLLRSALLFYRNLVKDIEACRFQINTYDPCVSKKMINEKYITAVCHVGELKVSHVDSFEITKFAGYLESKYGGLVVNRGKVCDCSVMSLDYIKQVTVKFSMIKYLDSVIQ